ncbi:hypothetical protein M5689_010306 [Euphorbia peplus]|nr:hypothetical protein M5689_010306 [Euphorbia peplus]
MSEQAVLSDYSRRTVVYFYHHKPVHTSDGDIKTQVSKFVNSDFFGSSFFSRTEELDQMEKKVQLKEEALRERDMQHIRERLRFLKHAGKLDLECVKKCYVLDIVEMYVIKKEKDELHKMKEDYEKLKEEVTGPLLLFPPTPPAPCTGSQ